MIVAELFSVRCDVCGRLSTQYGDSQAQALYLAAFVNGFTTAPNGDHLCKEHKNEYVDQLEQEK